MNKPITYCYFGHPKSGSTWLGGLMGRICIEQGIDYFYGQLGLASNIQKLLESPSQAIISQNSSYENLSKLDINYKGFHVIRDPRDVCISAYFSYKKTHDPTDFPGLLELREKLAMLDFNDGLNEIMKFNKNDLGYLSNWNFLDPNILEMKYEDIIKNPPDKISKAMNFMGLLSTKESPAFIKYLAMFNRVSNKISPNSKLRIQLNSISNDRITAICNENSFEKLSKGRIRGKEDTNSHYRKGVSGDWKNYFNESNKDFFKELYGDLIIKLGYEKDNNW